MHIEKLLRTHAFSLSGLAASTAVEVISTVALLFYFCFTFIFNWQTSVFVSFMLLP